MRKVFTVIVAVLGVLAISLAGLSGAAQASTVDELAQLAKAAAALPPGEYPDGTIIVCVQTSAPRALRAHLGAKTKACPKGSQKMDWASAGKTGPKGATGARGQQGPSGEQGIPGPAGASAAAPVYGTALVQVSRGGAAASTWATVSTSVGSPDGDTASNTFRMTCSEAKAPCVVSTQARATEDGVRVHPRLLISKQGTDAKPLGTCEYADGTDNDGGTLALTDVAATVPLGIGGSLDCGSDQVRPGSGVVESITVPAGYYDIAATFTFSR